MDSHQLNDRSLHFLVVDDDPESRKTVIEYLTSLGFAKFSQAKDGIEAWQVLERVSGINFIISDWDMPMMNGLTLLQRVRSHPSTSNIPFLIMTSPISQEAEKVILAAESYVDAYIIKPFRSQTLSEKIDQLLNLSVRGPQKMALVVDDDTDSREMVVEFLKKLGFKSVEAYPDGKAALEFLKDKADEVGLIVSDWEMPQMSGIELLRALKGRPSTQEIPFLMITSQSSMERMKVMQAAQAQVDQYLLKPFTGADLKKRIDVLLDKKKNRKQIQELIGEAAALVEKGSYQKAQLLYETALQLDPENDIALRSLGDVAFKTKGVESALPFYKKAVEANPANVRSYIKLSTAYEQIGLLDKAIALLQTGMKQISFSSELHFQLGRLYNKKGMLNEARIEFEKTLELQLDHQEARIMLEMLGSKRKE